MVKFCQAIEGHGNDINSIDYCHDLLATGSSDKLVRIYRKNPSEDLFHSIFQPLEGHTYGVNCVRFIFDGEKLASCSTDGSVIIWCMLKGIADYIISRPSQHALRALSYADEHLACGGDDEIITIWHPLKFKFKTLRGHESSITTLCMTSDGSLLVSGASDGTMFLWDVKTLHAGALYTYADAHDLGLTCGDIKHKDISAPADYYTLATCGNDDLVKIWKIHFKGKYCIAHLHTCHGHTSSVLSCRFSLDGTLLASTGNDHSVILWNPVTGSEMFSFEGHTRAVTCCTFVENNYLATGSSDRNLSLWHLDVNSTSSSVSNDDVSSRFLNEGSPKDWTNLDVLKWLKQIGLTEYSEIFTKNNIDGSELIQLTNDKLESLEIYIYAHRMKLMTCIQVLTKPLMGRLLPDSIDNIIPSEFKCPITCDIMQDPVVATDGHSYERESIERWFSDGSCTSPMTNEQLTDHTLIPNRNLQSLIKRYLYDYK